MTTPTPRYTTDEDGVVHLMNPLTPGGVFTFCDRAGDGDSIGDDGAFYGKPSRGPATCHECKKAVDALRAGIGNVRWRLT